jgi:hypothetical protein
VHAKALADTRDVSAAIRDLARDSMRAPDWAIPRLIW